MHLASHQLPSSAAEGPTQIAFEPLAFTAVGPSSACLSVRVFLREILRITHSKASGISICGLGVSPQLVAVCLPAPLGGAASEHRWRSILFSWRPAPAAAAFLLIAVREGLIRAALILLLPALAAAVLSCRLQLFFGV